MATPAATRCSPRSGDLLPSVLRVSDFVARVGGEEFVALLPDTSRDGALVIAEKLRSSVAGLECRRLGRQVTISLGVAVLPDDADEGARISCARPTGCSTLPRNAVATVSRRAPGSPRPT